MVATLGKAVVVVKESVLPVVVPWAFVATARK
jgi:hypothetical protein